MVQLPALVSETMLPASIEQLPVATKLTVSPEVAVPVTRKSGSPNVLSVIDPKVIVWLACPTDKV
jgi:hypothetical protein